MQEGGFDSAGIFITPIMNGQYIIAYMTAGFGSENFSYWYAILEPTPGGDPIVLGAVYYTGLVSPPYLNYLAFVGISNDQTADDPILFRATGGFGGGSGWGLIVLPSVNAIIDKTYIGGYGSGYTNPLELPVVFMGPIGTANLSTNLLAQTGGTNGNVYGGFTLPDNSGGTNLYFYFSRSYMDFCAANHGSGDVEVYTTIQPSYPDGAMIRIAMGNVNYTTLANEAIAMTLGGTPTYTIDNAHWINSSSVAQIPFADEYTYISTNTAGGTDTYTMQPGCIINRGGGVFWVAFFMPGLADAAANTGNTVLHGTMRIFEYKSSTQVATQFLDLSCVLYTVAQVPSAMPVGLGFAPNDFKQCVTLTPTSDLEVIASINGLLLNSPFTQVYGTTFCSFPIPS